MIFSNATTNQSGHNFSVTRSKMIFVAINNCRIKERLDLIRKLKTNIGIDVYGKCGKLVGDQHLPQCRRFTRKCRSIMSKYRFYFAMENSYCDHYITEKYYENGLNSGLIPIVLGGADYKDSKFALQGSYINIEEFHDLKTLATYLKQVAKNETLFNSFFWWKNKYKIHRKSKGCAICKRLWKTSLSNNDVYGNGDPANQNNMTHSMVKMETGQNLHQFWNVERSCRKWKSVIERYL